MEGLRGLAVLMVFFVHFHALFGDYARNASLLWWSTDFLGTIGNSGVDLFFVLSGYLIYGALIRRAPNVLRFLRRRVERIYPTFLAVFALYLVLSVLFPDASRLHGQTWIGASTYVLQNLLLLPGIFNIPPLITLAWSLSYEFFFYISAVILVRTVRMWSWRPGTRRVFFAAIWCGYLVVCFSVEQSRVRALMFLVGILLYEALSDDQFIRLLKKRGEIVAIGLFIGGLAYVYLLELRQDLFSFLPGWRSGRSLTPGVMIYQGPYKTMALSITMFWLAAYCLAYDGILKRVFSWAPLRYLGNMSYSYYLIHGVTLQGVALIWLAIASHGVPRISLFVAALPIALLATWVSSTALFLLVEKPTSFQRNGRAASAKLRAGICQFRNLFHE